MFETPAVDLQEIRSVLTDAGHTAAGFATLAVKRANDLRLDVSARYEDQIVDLRKQALVLVNRVESVRSDVEAAVEPVMARVVDRLPAPAQKAVNQVTEATKELQIRAHEFVVSALTLDETPVKSATTAAQSKATTKTTKNSAATSAKKTGAAKPAARSTKPAKAKTVKAKTVKKAAKATASKATKKSTGNRRAAK